MIKGKNILRFISWYAATYLHSSPSWNKAKKRDYSPYSTLLKGNK
jgi:hypothetical protein